MTWDLASLNVIMKGLWIFQTILISWNIWNINYNLDQADRRARPITIRHYSNRLLAYNWAKIIGLFGVSFFQRVWQKKVRIGVRYRVQMNLTTFFCNEDIYTGYKSTVTYTVSRLSFQKIETHISGFLKRKCLVSF